MINDIVKVASTDNAGKRWSKNDDTYLMLECKKNTSVVLIANTLKRTISAINTRIIYNIINMVDAENTVEKLCEEYRLDVKRIKKRIISKEIKEKTQKKLTMVEILTQILDVIKHIDEKPK